MKTNASMNNTLLPFTRLLLIILPLLGNGGYLPFALELFALYRLVVGLFGFELNDYLQIKGAVFSKAGNIVQ